MKVLLDTHLLLWTLMDFSKLPEKARKIINDVNNEIYYSIISLWEIELKRVNNPVIFPYTAEVIEKICHEKTDFHLLQLTQESIYQLDKLQRPESVPRHKDPFDRMLICQALAKRDMLFLTHDSLLGDYNVSNIIIC